MTHTDELITEATILFREYRTRCFWHCPIDMEISLETIPVIIKGLQHYGGRAGFLAGDRLKQLSSSVCKLPTCERDAEDDTRNSSG